MFQNWQKAALITLTGRAALSVAGERGFFSDLAKADLFTLTGRAALSAADEGGFQSS